MHALRWTPLALLGLTAALATAAEKPAPKVDLYGDPLPEGAVARLGTERLRARCAQCLAFSQDSKLVAVGNADRTVRLWDAATGREKLRVQGNELGQLQQIAFSPDGAILATLDHKHRVRLWDAWTGKHLRQAEGTFPWDSATSLRCTFAFTFAPDGRALYVGGPGAVRAINAADGKAAALPSPPRKGLSLDLVSPDGTAGLSVVGGGRLLVWDLESGKARAEVAGPKDPQLLTLSPGGKRLAVAIEEDAPAVLVYDLASGKELCRCQGHGTAVGELAFSPDGKALLGGCCDLTVRLWDAETGKERWSRPALRGARHWSTIAFAPDAKTVAITGEYDIIRLLDAADGEERVPIAGCLDLVRALAVAPDGRSVFTGAFDQSLRQWDLATGKEIRVLKGPVSGGFGGIWCLELTADGKTLAAGERKGVRLWDLSDPERPRDGGLIDDQTWCALSPDGKTLATVEEELRLLDLRSGKRIRTAKLSEVAKMRFSPDGRTLAVGSISENTVRLYDARAWRERAVLAGKSRLEVRDMEFSPDGQLLATPDGQSLPTDVLVWEVASGKLRRRIETRKSWVNAVAFSPDGQRLAFAESDRDADLWSVSVYDLASGRVIHRFRGHDAPVNCLAFTPDGGRLISGSNDTTALVWDMGAVPASAVRVEKRSAKELDALWDRLAGDAEKADEAMRELAASPAQAAELLGRSLKPVGKEQAERIARLVRDLDSDTFAERERASAALEELGEDAAEALRKALDDKPSPEVRRRAEELLGRLRGKAPSPERLRGLRAVQVLEWIGSPEARRTLKAVAEGPADAELTRAAKAALACLKKR
jgi:WD40 repeat protein